jgi:hypothetical protein
MGPTPNSLLRTTRAAKRYPTKIAAILVVDRKSLDVDITDLSRVGARLQGDYLPERGDEVVLRTSEFEVVATIAWSEGDSCGLNFHKAIEPIVVRKRSALPSLNTLISAQAMRV